LKLLKEAVTYSLSGSGLECFAFMRIEPVAVITEANISTTTLQELPMNAFTTAGGSVSLFFSRNPLTSYNTCKKTTTNDRWKCSTNTSEATMYRLTHLSSIMLDHEMCRFSPGLGEMGISRQVLVQLRQKSLICGTSKLAFLIHESK
jgi:hypothetical protein